MAQKITNKIVLTDTLLDTNLATDSVGSSELKASAVVERNYSSLSIPTSAYKDGSIITSKYADRSVTGVKIALKGITEDSYADNSVPSSAYKDGSIITSKYADRSITGAKVGLATLGLENMAPGSVDGNILGAGAVSGPHVVDASIPHNKLVGGVVGDILVVGASGAYERLGKGVENSVMAIKNNVPTWTSSILNTGFVADFLSLVPPEGWVSANGKTIGSASSGATERANADCENLFKFLWANFPNAVLGVSGGRGANANVDWAANKTIVLPDMRGRMTVGHDAMNNSNSGRVAGTSSVGATGGVSTNLVTEINIPPHNHIIAEYEGSRSEGYSGGGTANSPNDVLITWAWPNSKLAYEMTKSPRANPTHNVGRTSNFGSTNPQPLNNMTPFFVTMKMIKL